MNTAAPTYRTGIGSVPAEGTSASLEERATALAFLQSLASEVSGGNVDLPCFPGVVVKISLALSDPKTTSDKVETIVGAEPRLAARILQTANSAAFNTTGKTLTDLSSAITRLGLQMVQGVAMCYAVQQMKEEALLKAIAEPLQDLWKRSIEVASISRVLAARTRLRPDEAFLAGLLHGIGKLYILVRAATRPEGAGAEPPVIELIAGWHASIGKAVLESWGFGEEICEAIADQGDFERRWRHAATLTDVLIASIVLGEALNAPPPRTMGKHGINAFMSIGIKPPDCEAVLGAAEQQIRLVIEALA